MVNFFSKDRRSHYDYRIEAALALSNASIGVRFEAGSDEEIRLLVHLFKRFIVVDPDKTDYLNKLQDDYPNFEVVHMTAKQWFVSTVPTYNFLDASDILPFLLPEDFSFVWNHIVESLKPGGFFVGRVFGNHDAVHHLQANKMTLLSKSSLLSKARESGLKTLFLNELYQRFSSREDNRHVIDFVFRKI